MKVCRWGFFLRWQVVFRCVYLLVSREVFASMQSGNVILLGINLSTGQFEQAFRYLPPIFMFLVGIVVTNYLQHHFPTGGWIVWQKCRIDF